MNRKFLIAIAALLIAAVGIAACGSDDGDSTGSDAAATTEETTAEETTTEADSGGGAGGSVAIEADPSGSLAYTTGAVEVDSGPVAIEFDNASSVGHDVRIEDSSGNDVGGTEIFSGGSETAEVDLEPGTYAYYCSVGGHRAAGMEETLTVE